jgi:hypothetical protein
MQEELFHKQVKVSSFEMGLLLISVTFILNLFHMCRPFNEHFLMACSFCFPFPLINGIRLRSARYHLHRWGFWTSDYILQTCLIGWDLLPGLD